MKRILILLLPVLFILISCEKEETGNPKPKQLNATDGAAVGCIHIDFEKDPEVNTVIIERREKGAGEWQVITGTELTSFDDNAGYPNIGMPPGKVFEYRIKNDWPDDAEYSEIEEGYAYDIIPVTEIEITSSVQWNDETNNILIWNEENNGSFINESEIFFEIYRSQDSLGTYQKVGQVGEDRSYTDILPASMKGQKVYYRVDVFYSFSLNMPSGGYHSESTEPVQGTIVGASSDTGENATIEYTTTELGQIASSQGGIAQLFEKNVDGTLYLGLINDAGATGYGIPMLYKLNGANWENVWDTNPVNEFDEINFAVSSSIQYVAGIDDSLCVYSWNGSTWSDNIAPDNLGKEDSPSSVSIETDNDILYMAIMHYPDYDLQVLKYTGSSWEAIGGDTDGNLASGTIMDATLEKIDGVVYLRYLIDNTLYIKHLNGSTWETDLVWTKDNIANIDIAKSGTDLYFISGSSNSTYRGGVYKVLSTTTVEEIISNSTDEWFQFPMSITIDSADNLIVASMKFESAESYYPFLNLYDGTEWNTISGDFTDGTDPVSINATGTDIFYIYGDATSENSIGDPTLIKSKKLSR